MALHPLDPAFNKLRRAETHIKDLKAAIRAFIETSPYRLTSDLNEERTEQVWRISIDPIPWEIEAIAADAVHNLRTPLDKMLTADFRNPAIHTSKAKVQRIKFPGIKHFNEFEVILTSLEEHLTRPVIEFLRATKPYEGGAGQVLSAINGLDNQDKHRALLEPVKPAFTIVQQRSIHCTSGFLLCIGSRQGKHYVPVPEARPGAWDMHQPIEALAPILRIAPATVRDYFLEFTSPYNDMEIFTTTPGAKVQADFHPAINIAFREIRDFEGQPVIDALETMRQSVEATLDEFARAFF